MRLAIAVAVPMLSNLIDAIGIIEVDYEITLLANLDAITILLWAELHTESDGYMFTRDIVFDGLADPIFALAETGVIVDKNRSAQELTGTGGEGEAFSTWLITWATVAGYAIEYENNEQYLRYKDKILFVKHIPIQSKKGKNVGTYVELADVTSERKLLLQMSYLATKDMLTGLSNRTHYESEIASLSNSQQRFGAIVLDVNGLKR